MKVGVLTGSSLHHARTMATQILRAR